MESANADFKAPGDRSKGRAKGPRSGTGPTGHPAYGLVLTDGRGSKRRNCTEYFARSAHLYMPGYAFPQRPFYWDTVLLGD